MGFEPGPIFKIIIDHVNLVMQKAQYQDLKLVEADIDGVIDYYRGQIELEKRQRKTARKALRSWEESRQLIHKNIECENRLENTNLDLVTKELFKIGRTPTVTKIVVMPDACPTGRNSMPVGTIVAAKNAIHPGWHSADICCSVYASNFGKANPRQLLDSIYSVTHFGPGERKSGTNQIPMSLYDKIVGNVPGSGTTPFFDDTKLRHLALTHFCTQGDGNHFAFVGSSKYTGDTWLITHHGSRGFGARLYKLGMKVAQKYRTTICPEAHKNNAWIPADTEDGKQYWQSLQIVREWTKENHKALHIKTQELFGKPITESFWNEHNFVFEEDGIFWHAKGATPIHDPFLPDTKGIQIIPLNMAEPILFVAGKRNGQNFGFAPHGAGRNVSRTAHKKTLSHLTPRQVFEQEVSHLDVRWWYGDTDISELPSAYKNASHIERQMNRFNLATVVDRIQPYGSIMAGIKTYSN